MTFLRFPSRHALATAVSVLSASGDDRAQCARLLRLRFPNYTEKPATGVGVELSAVLDSIERERVLHPPVKRHAEFRPYPQRRRSARA